MDYWLGSQKAESNRFEILENQELEDIETVNTEKSFKTPPTFISGVSNISPLINLLNSIAKDNHYIKVLSQEQVKVQAKTIEVYDTIIASLKEKDTEYHTFQKKNKINHLKLFCGICITPQI